VKLSPECVPCFLKQVVNVSKIAGLGREETFKILKETAVLIAQNLQPQATPGHNATIVHRFFKEKTKIDDPYRTVKDKFNNIAMSLESEIEEKFFQKAEDKLSVAIKISALGNVIDFGVPRKFDLEKEIESFFTQKFAYFDIAIFERFLVPGKTVLLIGDNAGEIVFDKFLVRVLKEHKLKVILAVRGSPILNDATIEDAVKTGIAEIVDDVITTGNDFIGVELQSAPEEFKKVWKQSYFVISKGQANFETLNHITDKDIFFILKAKCKPVARELNCRVNDLIFLYNKKLAKLRDENS